MSVIRLYVNDQKLSAPVAPKIASGDKETVTLRVGFSNNWRDYNKSVVFYASWDTATTYEVLLDNGMCVVPHEVLCKSGYMYIGVRGVKTDAIKTSSILKYRIEKGTPTGTDTPKEPTPDLYQQILKRLEEIKAYVPQKGVDYFTQEDIDMLVEELLNQGGGGIVSPEMIEDAVNKYLDRNPVEAVPIDDSFSETSTNPLQNKVVTQKFAEVTTEINNVNIKVGEAELLLSNI